MKFIILICITIFFYATMQKPNTITQKKYIQLNTNSQGFSAQSFSLYKAMLTGDKRNIKRKTKQIFKKYGFIHLLTPSGIHLSSLLFAVSFSKILEMIILIIIFATVIKSSAYHSLERVIIFKMFTIFSKKLNLRAYFKIEVIFGVTFMTSILLGHLTKNPLSFIYSFVFWGTILIFRNKKGSMLIHLNFVLFFMNSLVSSSGSSPLSIIINPLITSFISLIFPIFVLNGFLPATNNLNNIIHLVLDKMIDTIIMIDHYDPFFEVYFSIPLLMLSLILLEHFKIKSFILLLCLTPLSTYKNEFNPIMQKVFINLGDKTELLKIKKRKLIFIDQKCQLDELEINCTRTKSQWGGPSI